MMQLIACMVGRDKLKHNRKVSTFDSTTVQEVLTHLIASVEHGT